MAKQAGLHQIRGKMGEHSYYQQSGVDTGLIRRINQGMGERVKTGDEYANTRLNMAEFGQAGRIAGQIVRYITPKYRPMPLLFSQSILVKKVLDALKQNNAAWGMRNIHDQNGDILAPILSSMSKNQFDEYGVSLEMLVDELHVNTDNVLCPAKLSAIGADGYFINANFCNTLIGQFINDREYAPTYARANMHADYMVEDEGLSFSNEFPSDAPGGGVWENNKMIAIIVMPYRTILGEKNILQSKCVFKVFSITEIPVHPEE